MSSDDETEQFSSWKGVPATIICINISDGQQSDGIEVALGATNRLMRQYLRISSSQLTGVCLFGTEGSNTSVFGIKSVEEVFPLSLPNLNNYTKLKEVQISSLKQTKDLELSNALWYCNRAFASCNKQLSSRTVIILSRFDVPPLQTDQKPAVKRIVDLIDSNIDVRLLNISETDYEPNEFYTKILSVANNGEEVPFPKPVWDPKEIQELMYQQSHRNLAVTRLSFHIGEDLAIGVAIYNLLKSSGQTQQKKTYLQRETNAILTSVNKTMKVKVDHEVKMDVDEDSPQTTSEPVLKSELLHYQTYGDERIEFTDDEYKMLKNPFGPPMLKLLGFKPASAICKEKWYFKSGYFLFPNDSIIEGSFVAFKALHQACTETNKVAICVMCTRINARPVIVALSPTSKPLGLDVEIGFDVICIPFVENVRNIPTYDDEDVVQPCDANKTVMTDIINHLRFDYKADMFENPKLQAQYNAVEAVAQEDDISEPFIDTTKRDAKIFQGIQDVLFQELFGPFGVTAVKKSASSKQGGPDSKKAKTEDIVIDEDLLARRLENEKIKDYTVAQLKDILKFKKISNLPAMTGLKKGELVDLVYKHCQ